LSRGALIDRASTTSSVILRDMRGHVHVAALGHEVGCVEALVAAHGHPGSVPVPVP
jgi:hypothetical protein